MDQIWFLGSMHMASFHSCLTNYMLAIAHAMMSKKLFQADATQVPGILGL